MKQLNLYWIGGGGSSIPDGKTVTPINDVTILQQCAGRTETYTTISALLADAAALAGVINSNNAIDYLVRSTTFASDICADQGAMTDIGANNYASDTLLANSTWLTAICGSSYFESVLNVKVPTMTSNTTPSGVASASSVYVGSEPYYCFDNNNSTFWENNGQSPKYPCYIGYKFESAQKIYCMKQTIRTGSGYDTRSPKNFKVQGSNDNSNWIDVFEGIGSTNENSVYIMQNVNSYEYYREYVTTDNGAGEVNIITIQFYGRADV